MKTARILVYKSSLIGAFAGAFLLGLTQLPAQDGAINTTAARTNNAAARDRFQTNLRLPKIQLHDPWILAHEPNKTYYLYTSNAGRTTGVFRPGTMAYRSKDLLNWEGPLVVFSVPQGTWASDESAWAPEVHPYKGRFYLFTTLHNSQKIIATPPQVWRTNHMRATVIAVSDSPEGPFTLLDTNRPVTPTNFMTLDGTLFVDKTGKPWMVYAHEWIQKIDGTIEAIPLSDDLSKATGAPIHLFKGSDAPWLNEHMNASVAENHYVTDGCQFYRTKDDHLLMLWSSYDRGSYVQTVARSKSGELKGPWEQLAPLVGRDSGHGMLFRTFEGQLMMVLHRPFRNARGKLYEMSDEGDHLRIVRQRTDLDGD